MHRTLVGNSLEWSRAQRSCHSTSLEGVTARKYQRASPGSLSKPNTRRYWRWKDLAGSRDWRTSSPEHGWNWWCRLRKIRGFPEGWDSGSSWRSGSHYKLSLWWKVLWPFTKPGWAPMSRLRWNRCCLSIAWRQDPSRKASYYSRLWPRSHQRTIIWSPWLQWHLGRTFSPCPGNIHP